MLFGAGGTGQKAGQLLRQVGLAGSKVIEVGLTFIRGQTLVLKDRFLQTFLAAWISHRRYESLPKSKQE
jgi:hypothetical protein